MHERILCPFVNMYVSGTWLLVAVNNYKRRGLGLFEKHMWFVSLRQGEKCGDNYERNWKAMFSKYFRESGLECAELI